MASVSRFQPRQPPPALSRWGCRPDRAVGCQDRRKEFDLRAQPAGWADRPGVVVTYGPAPIKGTIAIYGLDGQTIVSAGQGQRVMIWDAATSSTA